MNWKNKQTIAAAITVLLIGFGLTQYQPLAPLAADIVCAAVGCVE